MTATINFHMLVCFRVLLLVTFLVVTAPLLLEHCVISRMMPESYDTKFRFGVVVSRVQIFHCNTVVSIFLFHNPYIPLCQEPVCGNISGSFAILISRILTFQIP